jgi:metal-responsive CopG/Arc/MetJ family transcriptional regulator
MARTTIDIDDPILKEIKAIQKREGRSMGQIVSQLLAEALIEQRTSEKTSKFRWISRSMRSLVDLSDKDEVYRILDRDQK